MKLLILFLDFEGHFMCRETIFVYQNINDKINKYNVKFEEI